MSPSFLLSSRQVGILCIHPHLLLMLLQLRDPEHGQLRSVDMGEKSPQTRIGRVGVCSSWHAVGLSKSGLHLVGDRGHYL